MLIRYVLLFSLVLPAMLLFASCANADRILKLAMASALIWQLNSIYDHFRFVKEQNTLDHRDTYAELSEYLLASGYKYGYAQYWHAYRLKFISNQDLTVASTTHVRIEEDQKLVNSKSPHVFSVSLRGHEKPHCDNPSHFQKWDICFLDKN